MYRQHIKKATSNSEISSDSDDDYLQQTARHLTHPLDSGASANIKDEYQFKAFRHRSLVVKSEFPVTLSNKYRGTESEVLVVQEKMDSRPLLYAKPLYSSSG